MRRWPPLKRGDAVEVFDSRFQRWVCSDVRAVVSDGFQYTGTYGTSFTSWASRYWRRPRKGRC